MTYAQDTTDTGETIGERMLPRLPEVVSTAPGVALLPAPRRGR